MTTNLKQKVVGFYRCVSMKVWFAFMMLSGLITTAAAEGEDTGTAAATGGDKDIFSKVGDMFKDVYVEIVGISSAAAGVCAAVCLFLMFFSKSPKTVEESTSWLKRIVVCWIALMSISAIIFFLQNNLGISASPELLP